MDKIVFYDNVNSPCCRRVHVSLLEKDLAFDTIPVDLANSEQKQAWYLKINPDGKVPALTHNDKSLGESNIITEYLDDVFPDSPLYPEDPWENAQVKMWQAFELRFAKSFFSLTYQTIQGPVQRLTKTFEEHMAVHRIQTSDPAFLLYQEKSYKGTTISPAEIQHHRDILIRCLVVIEQSLVNKDYLVGSHFSQADISLYPRLAMFPLIGIPVDAQTYPNTTRWVARLKDRPSIKRTKPSMEGKMNPSVLKQIHWAADNKDNPDLSLLQKLRIKFMKKMLSKKQSIKKKKFHTKGVNNSRPARRLITVDNQAPLTLMTDDLNLESQLVKAALAQLELEYTEESIDTLLLEQESPSFKVKYGDVPVPILMHGDREISGYMVILDYINKMEGAKTGTLLPVDAYTAATLKIHLYGDAEGWHKYFQRPFDQLVLGKALRQRFQDDAVLSVQLKNNGADDSQIANMLDAYRDSLCTPQELQAALSKTDAKLGQIEKDLAEKAFVLGNYSFADTALYLALGRMESMGAALNEAKYPAIAAWKSRLPEMAV